MKDRLARNSYAWAINIIDKNTEASIFNHIYKNQVFRLSPGRIARPTFAETLPMAPGEYRVELLLVLVREQEDLDEFGVSNITGGNTVLKGLEDVSLR